MRPARPVGSVAGTPEAVSIYREMGIDYIGCASDPRPADAPVRGRAVGDPGPEGASCEHSSDIDSKRRRQGNPPCSSNINTSNPI